MVTVQLLGALGNRFGRNHRFDISTPSEAVRALCANFKGFDRYLIDSESKNIGYRVRVGKSPISAHEFFYPSGRETIQIVPVVMGSGSGSSVIIGGALMLAAIYYPPLAATTLFGTTTLATISFTVGFSLALGGIAQMLSPHQKASSSERPDNKPGYVFNGAVNTTTQGHPVPVGYGRMIVGSAVISAGISTEDIS